MYKTRKLSESLSTFSSLEFPSKVNAKSAKRHKVVVGIGGNVGDVKRRFNHLLTTIKRDKRVDLLETSLILKNPPFGYTDQDDSLNSIIVLKVNMEPFEFLDYLMRLEKRFSRTRSFANAPRTLDLDIIFFDKRVINTKRLTIPHKDWKNRQSVLIPLSGLSI